MNAILKEYVEESIDGGYEISLDDFVTYLEYVHDYFMEEDIKPVLNLTTSQFDSQVSIIGRNYGKQFSS